MAGNGIVGKVIMTVAVVVAAIPGLVLEPGPLSEIAALAILGAIWLPESDVSEEL